MRKPQPQNESPVLFPPQVLIFAIKWTESSNMLGGKKSSSSQITPRSSWSAYADFFLEHILFCCNGKQRPETSKEPSHTLLYYSKISGLNQLISGKSLQSTEENTRLAELNFGENSMPQYLLLGERGETRRAKRARRCLISCVILSDRHVPALTEHKPLHKRGVACFAIGCDIEVNVINKLPWLKCLRVSERECK